MLRLAGRYSGSPDRWNGSRDDVKLIRQIGYKGHTLLQFRQRGLDAGEQEASAHWIIIAPDGINVLGRPQATEANAKALVDRLAGAQPDLDDPRR